MTSLHGLVEVGASIRVPGGRENGHVPRGENLKIRPRLLSTINMFGGPGAQPNEEQKKLQEQYSMDTLKLAGVMAGALWVTPIIYHYIRKQF